jgi:hypothetical protein
LPDIAIVRPARGLGYLATALLAGLAGAAAAAAILLAR